MRLNTWKTAERTCFLPTWWKYCEWRSAVRLIIQHLTRVYGVGFRVFFLRLFLPDKNWLRQTTSWIIIARFSDSKRTTTILCFPPIFVCRKSPYRAYSSITNLPRCRRRRFPKIQPCCDSLRILSHVFLFPINVVMEILSRFRLFKSPVHLLPSPLLSRHYTLNIQIIRFSTIGRISHAK